MATVFVARDVKHDRRVALKVLDPELGAVLGAERFLSEIRVTANLQHPNLLPLFDSGDAAGLLFYVMPFVEGESLRARLEREKQLPVDDAVRIAASIADALEYAHARGIVHRDLKPENVLLQHGQPIVADFGIALAVSNAGGTRVTQTGLSLGTPQYMSPEQATGDRAVDARSDIYSLGALTYEMLAGEPPHIGQTAQAIIARVLTEKPRGIRATRPAVSAQIEDTVLRALEKLPADRWASARQFAEALNRAAHARLPRDARERSTLAGVASFRSPVLWAACALIVASGALAADRMTSRGSTHTAMRFALEPPLGVSFDFPLNGASWLALSPDGRTLVYSAQQGDFHGLWTQRIGELEASRVPTGEFGRYPAFSPDGKSLVFADQNQWIRRVPLDGGDPVVVYKSGYPIRGLTVDNSNDVIFASPQNAGALWRVSLGGGTAERIETDSGALPSSTSNTTAVATRASADGKFVFYTLINGGQSGINVVTTRDWRSHRVRGASNGLPVAMIDGVLYWVQEDGALVGSRFDAGSYSVGTPERLADSVANAVSVAAAAISPEGPFVYAQGVSTSGGLDKVDDKGASTPFPGLDGVIDNPRLSPDGKRLLYRAPGGGGDDIWLFDLPAGTRDRVTHGGANDMPEWSADGKHALFISRHGNSSDVQSAPLDGSATPTTLTTLASTSAPIVEAVPSRDGAAMVYTVFSPATGSDVYLAPASGGIGQVFAGGPGDQLMPRFSPNSQWIAYQSDEAGRREVYVKARDGHARLLVSSDRGQEPIWSPDGTRLLYRDGRNVMAATLSLGAEPAVVRRDTVLPDLYVTSLTHASWDVFPDGKHFLFEGAIDSNRRQILVLNWLDDARARMNGGPR